MIGRSGLVSALGLLALGGGAPIADDPLPGFPGRPHKPTKADLPPRPIAKGFNPSTKPRRTRNHKRNSGRSHNRSRSR